MGGRKNGVGHTAAGRAIAAVMGSQFGQGNSVYHHGTEPTTVDHIPFGAYPIDVVRELGGWDETQLVNEDFEFDYRLRQTGRELLFDPAIQIAWDCRQSVPDLFRQYRRYGRGKAQTLQIASRVGRAPPPCGADDDRRPGGRRGVGPVPPNPLARRSRSRPRTSGSWRPGPSRPWAGSTGTREKLWVAPAFVALHLGWGIGFWREVLAIVRRGGGARPGLAGSARP